VTELRKEIARLKEANDRLSQHSSEIETRLTKSEGHAAVLIAQIEKHEKEVMERVQAYRDLEAHVALLDTSKDNKLLLESLAEKEQRISQLEQQIIDQTAGLTEREQLRQSVQVEKAAQAELRAKLAHLEVSSASSTRDASIASFDDAKEQLPNRSPVPTVKELTPPESPSSVRPTSNDDHVAQLEAALRDLEARCADAEARYSEAEHQIAELSTQLSEAKLVHAELDDVMPVSPGAPSPGITDDTSESGSTTTLQTPRGSSRSSSPVRFASQRGSTSSTLAPVNGAVALKHRDFRHGRGSFGDLKRARPQSLSQELSSAQSLESSPRASWTGPPSALRLATSPSKHRQSLPAASTLKPLRSPSSLEAELRFVHEVVEKRDGELKDREAYIRQLEETLRLQHLIPSRKNSANSLKLATKPASAQLANGRMPSALAKNIPLPDSPVVLRVEIRDEDQDGGDVLPAEHTKERKLDERHNDQKGDEAVEAVEAERVSEMSPSSSQRFNDLKNTLSALASLDQNHAPDQEVQERIDTLLRSAHCCC
jgi:kinesin family protein 4/21/27